MGKSEGQKGGTSLYLQRFPRRRAGAYRHTAQNLSQSAALHRAGGSRRPAQPAYRVGLGHRFGPVCARAVIPMVLLVVVGDPRACIAISSDQLPALAKW